MTLRSQKFYLDTDKRRDFKLQDAIEVIEDLKTIETNVATNAAGIAGSVTLSTTQTISGEKSFSTAPKTDSISELTPAAGVTADGVKLKDGFVYGGQNLAVAANGTSKANPTQLTASFNVVTTSSGANTDVLLPDAQVGTEVIVVNNTATTIVVFATVGDIYDVASAVGANSTSVGAGEIFKFVKYTGPDEWFYQNGF